MSSIPPRDVRSLRARGCVVFVSVMVSALAAGCANPLPQYLKTHDTSQAIVTSAIVQERDASCHGLEEAWSRSIGQKKAAEAKVAAELVAPAPTLSRALQRTFGPQGSGTQAYEEARGAEARSAALERELVARKCGDPTRLVEVQSLPGAPPVSVQNGKRDVAQPSGSGAQFQPAGETGARSDLASGQPDGPAVAGWSARMSPQR